MYKWRRVELMEELYAERSNKESLREEGSFSFLNTFLQSLLSVKIAKRESMNKNKK